MKNRDFWKKYRDMFLVTVLLAVFVGGIFGVGSMFEIGGSKLRTVILPGEQFNSSLVSPPNSTVQIEAAIKRPNDFAIYDFEVADQNTLILSRPENSYTGIKISMLKLDDNHVKDLATNTEYGVALSPDQEKMIFSEYRSAQAQRTTYEYDIKSGQRRKLANDNFYFRRYFGNDTYIGYDILVFRMIDLSTGKKRLLYSDEEIKNLVAKENHIPNPDEVWILPDSMEFSRDLQYFYALVGGDNKFMVYRFSVNDRNNVVAYTPADEIQQFRVLKNGDLLVQGIVNKVQGLFIYRNASKRFDLLMKSNIWSFDLNEDESRIAYFTVLENQKNELHMAYLEGGKLLSDTVVYRNIDNFVNLKWNGDNLFVVSSSMEKSEIYRFTFRAW
ncbi:hypothetical protein EHV15_01565 [Paenibacillus oralis]|uniref:Uncharacterized protein n=1 Tax=Paenibacillus oralis TaxID=2490856 RepID=A0A3P3TUL3_9BACL|nr:hypothetical protein [Paenibacillus oralis]RRJ61807.1 hypothetical protein EHV15_01565 [Paenibacillus oralis]